MLSMFTWQRVVFVFAVTRTCRACVGSVVFARYLYGRVCW
jgi:hypothetical protein